MTKKLFSLFLSLALLFTTALAFPNRVYAEGDQPNEKICFNGESDYGWAYFFNLDRADDTLSLDELNITVEDGGGNIIDASKYDLAIYRPVYNDQNEEVERIQVETPLGIRTEDREWGYTEYVAVATFKEGSGHEGSVEGFFNISDKYSLLFVCADIEVTGWAHRERWTGHDRYFFYPGQNIDMNVRHIGTLDWLDKGTDYKVTYYRLSNPQDMDNPEYNFQWGHFFVSDDSTRIDGVPTEPGVYFAKVEGIAPYYGECDVIIDIWEDVEEYYFPENREMLPGWDGWIGTKYNAWIGNKDYPEGEDFLLEVSDVRIENAEPADALFLEGNNTDGWRYEAMKPGSADIVLTYEDYVGMEKEHRFTVNVSDTVYEVNLWPVSGEWQKLPGESIELEAFAVKKTAEQDEYNPDEWHHEETRENLDITWSLGEGSEEWATLTPHTDDPTKATLTFKDMPEGWNRIGERVDVCARVTDKDSNDPDEVRAERWEDFHVNDAYFMIAPALVESSLDVGESMEITPELRFYEYGKAGYETRDAAFNIEADENAVRVEPLDGGKTFRITRLENYWTEIRITAEWDEDGRPLFVDRRYHLDDMWYNIWFEDADPWMVFTDGDKDLIANVGGYENYADVVTAGYSLEFEAGFNYDFESKEWGTQFVKDEEYSVDGNVVTIHGAKLDSDKTEQQVYIIAKLMKGDSVLADNNCQVHFKQAWEDYDLEHHRNMLPGWPGWINSEGNVWAENTEHPWGEELQFKITNAEIESQNAFGESPVIELEGPDENGNWRYEAKNHGEAIIKLTYEDLGGASREHMLYVHVGSDVYHVNVNTADGKTRALPGEEVTLIAKAEHHSEDPDRHGNIESVIYDWNEEEFNNNYGDYATLTVDSTNSSRATLTFKDLSEMPQEALDGRWEHLWIEVIIYDDQDEYGNPLERSRGNIQIELANEFWEVAPYTNNRRLAVGDTETIITELQSFSSEAGEGYDIRNAHFRWYYNPDAIEITDANGKVVGNNEEGTDNYIDSEASYGEQVEFHIKRLRNSNERFEVKVDIQDRWGNWQEVEMRNYWLDELDYDIWFEPDFDHTSCNTVTSTFNLKKGNDVKEPLSISYELGEWDGDVGEWSKKLESGTDYIVAGDEVRIFNAKALEKDITNVGIQAMLKSGDEVIRESWAWLAIEDHRWDTGTVIEEPTCTETGIKRYTCSVCRTTKNEDLDKVEHNMSHHPAVAATCGIEGTLEHWACDMCNKTYADEAGDTVLDNIKTAALEHDYQEVPGSGREAACTVAGKEADKKCAHCGLEEAGAEIPAVGHTEEVIPAVAASCTTAGSTEGKKCSVCEAIIIYPTEIPAHGHNMSYHAAVAATCGVEGTVEHWSCDRCNKTYADEAGTTVLDKITTPALEHEWDSGIVTTQATTTSTGIKTYTCEKCGAKKTETIPKIPYAPGADSNQKAKDGTAIGAGASAAAADKAITTSGSDEGPAGSKFSALELKSTKQANNSITLSWKKASGAKKFVVYGNACGKKNKMIKLAELTGKSLKVSRINGAALKKGTYYKFMVVALDSKNNVVSTSKVVHVTTKGNKKIANPTKLTVKTPKALKKGKTHKLNAKVSGLKGKTHRAVSYESTNTKVATVNKKGVIKAVGKGTCYVYAYAQNGVFKRVKVTVK